MRRLDDPDLGESGRLAARAMAESLYTHSATIGGGFKLTAYHEALVERPPWTEMAEARGGPPAVPIGGA